MPAVSQAALPRRVCVVDEALGRATLSPPMAWLGGWETQLGKNSTYCVPGTLQGVSMHPFIDCLEQPCFTEGETEARSITSRSVSDPGAQGFCQPLRKLVSEL